MHFGTTKIKNSYAYSFIVALNASPFAAIYVLAIIPPSGQHARTINEALFEVEK